MIFMGGVGCTANIAKTTANSNSGSGVRDDRASCRKNSNAVVSSGIAHTDADVMARPIREASMRGAHGRSAICAVGGIACE
jgi:hypothetical protein